MSQKKEEKTLYQLLISLESGKSDDVEEAHSRLMDDIRKYGINKVIIGHYTPLQYAVKCLRYDFARYLINLGAEVNAKNYQGDTPLHLATTVDIVKLLLENGANINEQNLSGETLLHTAAYKANKEIITLLLNNGASAAISDKNGRFPLHYLFHIGNGKTRNSLSNLPLRFELVIELSRYGARLLEKDNEGSLALSNIHSSGKYELELSELFSKLVDNNLVSNSLCDDTRYDSS